jgi:hypothetical protein
MASIMGFVAAFFSAITSMFIQSVLE